MRSGILLHEKCGQQRQYPFGSGVDAEKEARLLLPTIYNIFDCFYTKLHKSDHGEQVFMDRLIAIGLSEEDLCMGRVSPDAPIVNEKILELLSGWNMWEFQQRLHDAIGEVREGVRTARTCKSHGRHDGDCGAGPRRREKRRKRSRVAVDFSCFRTDPNFYRAWVKPDHGKPDHGDAVTWAM